MDPIFSSVCAGRAFAGNALIRYGLTITELLLARHLICARDFVAEEEEGFEPPRPFRV
jgi:hypothetical protein